MAKGKIKVKDIEGDSEQIKNLFKDSGFDLNSYLNVRPLLKIHIAYVIISSVLFFSLTCLIWINVFNADWTKIATLGSILLLGVTLILVHYKYAMPSITWISFGIGLCLILLALNVYTPKELMKRLEEKTVPSTITPNSSGKKSTN